MFDLDGTLTDPKMGITKAFQYALAAFGIHEELDELTKFIGPPLRDVFMNNYGFAAQDVESVVTKYREYYSVTGLLENAVYAGIPEVLGRLRDAGAVMAVATSKAMPYAARILGHFRLGGYFSFVSGDEMDGSLTKDGKVEIVRIALDALDSARKLPSVIVGDRKHDITGGREAGIDSIGVTWGYGAIGELKEAGATWIAETTDDLFRIIAG